MHSLRGIVGGQRVRRGILGRTGTAPLAQVLLGAVGVVDVVTNNPRLAGLGHGHVEHPCVVLGTREVLGATVGRTNLTGL